MRFQVSVIDIDRLDDASELIEREGGELLTLIDLLCSASFESRTEREREREISEGVRIAYSTNGSRSRNHSSVGFPCSRWRWLREERDSRLPEWWTKNECRHVERVRRTSATRIDSVEAVPRPPMGIARLSTGPREGVERQFSPTAHEPCSMHPSVWTFLRSLFPLRPNWKVSPSSSIASHFQFGEFASARERLAWRSGLANPTIRSSSEQWDRE